MTGILTVLPFRHLSEECDNNRIQVAESVPKYGIILTLIVSVKIALGWNALVCPSCTV
jgi:hypothetical protein